MVIPYNVFSKDYYPSEETIEFFVWFNTNFADTNKSAIAHYAIIDHINSTNTKFKGIMASRGLSKTTLVGVYYMAYLLWKGEKPNVKIFRSAIYVMDTITKAKQVLRRVIDLIDEHRELFEQKFKVIRDNLGDDPMLEIYHYQKKRKMWFFVRGMGQSLRGTNVKERPDIIIFDDIESEQNAGTDETRAKNLVWFFANALPAGRLGDTEFIFIGTPMHKNSLIVLFADEDGKNRNRIKEEFGLNDEDIPEWHFIKVPIAKEFKKDMPTSEIVSAWEDRFPPKIIKQTYIQYDLAGTANTFWQEYMLTLKQSDTSIYVMDRIKYTPHDTIKNLIYNSSIYISLDLAARPEKEGDYASISVIAVDNNSGHWFLIDGVSGHLSVDEILTYIFLFDRRYKSTGVLFESVVFTTLFDYIINKEMIERRHMLNVITFNRSTSKLAVLKQFAIIVNNSAFWIVKPSDMNDKYKEHIQELVEEEMPYITKTAILAERDDVVDSIAQITLAGIELPISEPIENNEKEIEWSNPYDD